MAATVRPDYTQSYTVASRLLAQELVGRAPCMFFWIFVGAHHVLAGSLHTAP